MSTTLFALLHACDTAVIDDYEVEEFSQSGESFLLEWGGGGDAAIFHNQVLTFEEGTTDFDVTDITGETFSIEFFGARPHLVPADVVTVTSTGEDENASC